MEYMFQFSNEFRHFQIVRKHHNLSKRREEKISLVFFPFSIICAVNYLLQHRKCCHLFDPVANCDSGHEIDTPLVIGIMSSRNVVVRGIINTSQLSRDHQC